MGRVVRNATNNVTFAVASGPAAVWGVGSGDPSSQEPNHLPWRSAYHGLVRSIFRSTLDASASDEYRALQAQVNVDAGKGFSSSILQGPASSAPSSFTVTASAPGLPPATLTINLSTDPSDSVLAVAAASVGVAYTGE